MSKELLVILGPTATGKTDLGLNLAKKFNGELVAADSRQVYIGLDIGTGKLPSRSWKMEDRRWKKEKGFWEIDGVKVWMYDVVNLETQYSVADYIKDAETIIEDIIERGKLPIVVGGTGLYIEALLEGLDNLKIPVDLALRGELEKLCLEELRKKLKSLSPIKWKSLNESERKNSRRLLRAIEIVSMNPYVNKCQKSKVKSQNWGVLKIGLTASREALYKNSDIRVIDWFKKGIIEEVKNFNKSSIPLERFKDLGLEYKLIASYLNNEIPIKDLIEKIQFDIHGYIRRQLTWFKKDTDINWFDITEKKSLGELEKFVRIWYDSGAYAKKN